MSRNRQMDGFRAGAEQDERYKATGRVEVRAHAAWMNSSPLIFGSITVGEARAFAVELLVAAERAEKVL